MCGIFLRLVSQLGFLLREITEMKDTGDFRTFSVCWQYYCGKNKNQCSPQDTCALPLRDVVLNTQSSIPSTAKRRTKRGGGAVGLHLCRHLHITRVMQCLVKYEIDCFSFHFCD